MVQRISLQESTDLLRFCIEQGEVVWGKHFKEELSERGNFSHGCLAGVAQGEDL
jgi:hypothetical protein